MTGTKNIVEKKKIMSGFANYFYDAIIAPICSDGDVAGDTLGSVGPPASGINTQDPSNPSPDDRRIDPRAIESDLLVEEAAADLGGTTDTATVRLAATRKHLWEKVGVSDGSTTQGRGCRVLKIQSSDAEVQSSAMQRKLTQMWDCLQVCVVPVLS